MKETNKLFSKQWNEKYPIRESAYSILDIIIKCVVVAFIAVTCLLLLKYAVSREEVVTCKKLVAQSEAGYAGKFYIAEWQDQMCRAHGIIINAETK